MHPQKLLSNPEYRFFSAATLPKIGHILGQKASFSKYCKIEMAFYIVFDYKETS